MAIALAISAAACWGLSDFLAGLASRRVAVPLVLLLVEGGGLLVLFVALAVSGPRFFTDASDVAQAVGSGLSGVLGLGCFYRALAIGKMSIVAPISATGVALPVVVGLATGNHPSTVVATGLVAVVCGVVLASRETHADEEAASAGRASIALALVSAAGFGGFFALSDAPADVSVVWTLILSRAAPLPFVAAIALARRPALPTPRFGVALAAVGCIDLAATALVALANTQGALSIVAVLGGMYPVMTVLLAAIVLHERLRGAQLVGVVLALGGVAAVAGG